MKKKKEATENQRNLKEYGKNEHRRCVCVHMCVFWVHLSAWILVRLHTNRSVWETGAPGSDTHTRRRSNTCGVKVKTSFQILSEKVVAPFATKSTDTSTLSRGVMTMPSIKTEGGGLTSQNQQ